MGNCLKGKVDDSTWVEKRWYRDGGEIDGVEQVGWELHLLLHPHSLQEFFGSSEI